MGSKVIRNVTKILKATSGRLFGRVTSGTGRAEELTPSDVRTLLEVATTTEIASAYQPLGSYAAAIHTHSTSDVTGLDTELSGKQETLVSGTNIKTINSTSLLGSGDIVVGVTVTGTGSVDNAVLRADGTGGATLQNSNWIIADNATASPNNTVNHASIQATGDTTNVSVSIKPKGTGSFSLDSPDGTTTGGNVRGPRAVDFQRFRGSESQVASGAISTAFGAYNTVSGDYACSGGFNSTVSGGGSFNWARTSTVSASYCGSFGENINISQSWAFAAGLSIVIEAGYSSAFGQTLRVRSTASNSMPRGLGAFTESFAEMADAAGIFSVFGDCQRSGVLFRGKTTNATPTELFLDGASKRLSIPGQFSVSRMFHARVLVTGIKSDGSAVAAYERRVVAKSIAGTAILVNSQTIGTDYEDNVSTDVSITVDDATDTMRITVTGIAGETWRWSAIVDFAKLGMGT